MEKTIAKEIRVGKRKEKEDKRAKWAAKLGSPIERATRKIVEKHAKT